MPAVSPAIPPLVLPTPLAERRHITVLSCALVDAAGLAAQLEPEDWHALVQGFYSICGNVLAQFGGHVAQRAEESILVYFGYPQAYEDHAQRAIHTGLRLRELLRSPHTSLPRMPTPCLAIRVGIHTGVVVIDPQGAGKHQTPLAVGATSLTARALRDLALPDTVVISETTAERSSGYFDWQILETQTLAGHSQPLGVYQVTAESAQQTRLEVAALHGLTPFVGRAAELGLLQERWSQAQNGHGQTILLRGEAGIGKSRLVRAWRETIAAQTHVRLECRGFPYHQDTPLYPVTDLLRRILHSHDAITPEAQLTVLERLVQPFHHYLPVPESIALLAALLGLALPAERYPPLALTPARQRQRTLETLVAMVLALATQQPCLLIVEDVHWMDPSTLEWLGLLMAQTPTAPLMTLLTYRANFHAPWNSQNMAISLTLPRLPRPHVEHMVRSLSRTTTVPATVVEDIARTTDGIPLFVEEMTRLFLTSAPPSPHNDSTTALDTRIAKAIPATLQDVLMTRLDQLGEARAVAQWLATLGQECALSLLQTVLPWTADTLDRALRRMLDADVLAARGVGQQTTYFFRHILIQETAYQSLPRDTRRQYHQRIAQVFEAQFPDITRQQPELLAHHYTEADLATLAVPYWQRAGQSAAQRSAYTEALHHLQRGLALLTTQVDTPQRLQQELLLQTTLGQTLMAIKGYAATEVQEAYARARELCVLLGSGPPLFPILYGLWGWYFVRAAYQTARDVAQQLLVLAQQVNNPAHVLEAHLAAGFTLFGLGEAATAHDHLEHSIAIYDPLKGRSQRALQNPGVAAYAYAAFALWLRGYPEQALQRSAQALQLAEALGQPYSLAYAMACTAMLHQFRREVQHAQERATAALVCATEHGFALWGAAGMISQGWALTAQGQESEGEARLRQGVKAWQGTGADLLRSYYLAVLAEVYLNARQPEAASSVLTEAVSVVETTAERFYEAELYRLQGQVLLQQCAPDRQQAEQCFQQARRIAQRQHATALELRATMSLGRLWQQQGKAHAARQLLGDTLQWFTEGFDTADWQDAHALLQDLQHAIS